MDLYLTFYLTSTNIEHVAYLQEKCIKKAVAGNTCRANKKMSIQCLNYSILFRRCLVPGPFWLVLGHFVPGAF